MFRVIGAFLLAALPHIVGTAYYIRGYTAAGWPKFIQLTMRFAMEHLRTVGAPGFFIHWVLFYVLLVVIAIKSDRSSSK